MESVGMIPIVLISFLFWSALTYPRSFFAYNSMYKWAPWATWAITISLEIIVTSEGHWTSAPVTVAGPSTSIIIVADSSLSTSKTNFLRFKIIDVTSSTTPSTAENSWIAPWTLIA